MEIVYNIPKGEPTINIEGKKGESLFRRPVIWFIKDDFKRISEQFEKYKNLVERAKEERLLALVGALTMEEALDSLLTSYIPDYKKYIWGNKDFTTSMKIKLAYSLRLIPRHILNSADLIRVIRNEFSHNLGIYCFDSLDDRKFKNKLRTRFREFFPDNTNNNLALKDVFIRVVETVIIGLGIYASHLKVVKEYIKSEDFRSELNRLIQKKAKRQNATQIHFPIPLG